MNIDIDTSLFSPLVVSDVSEAADMPLLRRLVTSTGMSVENKTGSEIWLRFFIRAARHVSEPRRHEYHYSHRGEGKQ